MIRDGILFHNVQSIAEDGTLVRIPESIRQELSPGGQNTAKYATGVELRFVMPHGPVRILLRAEPAAEAQVAYLMYGGFQSSWQNSSKLIYTHDTGLTIEYPDNLERLCALAPTLHSGFDPRVVRILLPYCPIHYLGVIGQVQPPTVEQMPQQCYLAYGSSITHGSLGLTPLSSYPFMTAQQLGVDMLDLGFAGSAWLEAAVAEHIVARQDWHFATFEFGVNMLGADTALFKQRVAAFVAILQRDPRPKLITDIFTEGFATNDKVAAFRKIVKEAVKAPLVYVPGTELLPGIDGLSADLVHPSLQGHIQIAQRLSDRLRGMVKITNIA
ncbi:GDSL-type esterase/lipase family protein [Lacticaseibacillus jixiensis]|uniref:GDSL-type esterase/lipase family protein n=1 Tax=Lacticaseibacillus jixiensis TaxID=3231926 RepID=UPI0036F3026E